MTGYTIVIGIMAAILGSALLWFFVIVFYLTIMILIIIIDRIFKCIPEKMWRVLMKIGNALFFFAKPIKL